MKELKQEHLNKWLAKNSLSETTGRGNIHKIEQLLNHMDKKNKIQHIE